MIRCVEVDLGQRRKICLTRGNQHVAEETLQVLGITQFGSAFSAGGSRMAHVVTKPKNSSFGFKELQVTMANMR